MVEELVERTVPPCERALADAGLKVADIHEVILVGGQTRMPLVQEKVWEIFAREPRRDVNPDEAVALGAAVQAAVLSGEIKDVLLLDVTPLSLGIETLGNVMTNLIGRNTTIPTRASEVFSTADDNQAAVTVHVLQGERDRAVDNKSLGRFELTDIGAAPRGTPQIEVAFDIDANGILNVSARDQGRGKEQSIVIRASSGLDESEIQAMVRDGQTHAEEDRAFRELATARHQAESLINTSRRTLEGLTHRMEARVKDNVQRAIADLEALLAEDDRVAIEAASQSLAQAMDTIEPTAEATVARPKPGSAPRSHPNRDHAIDAEFDDVA